MEANKKVVKTYTLLDTGSSGTFLQQSVAKTLQLEGPISSCNVTTINGSASVPCTVVSFSIFSVDRKHRFNVKNAISLDRSDMPRRELNPSLLKVNWPHLSDLNFDNRNTIQATVVIGRDINRALSVLEERHPPAGIEGPSAERTVFGWAIVGPVGIHGSSVEVHSVAVSSKANLIDLHQLVKQSFDIDSLGLSPHLKPLLTAADRRGLEILEAQTKHNGTRYQIGLMWKSAHIILPDNYSSAFRRLLTLE